MTGTAREFERQIEAHIAKKNARIQRIFQRSTEEVTRSVVEGSEITGAPGQRIEFGTLRGSYIPAFLSKWLWRLTSKLVYAPVHEHLDGPGKRAGGGHSIAKTRTGWTRIVDFVARQEKDR